MKSLNAILITFKNKITHEAKYLVAKYFPSVTQSRVTPVYYIIYLGTRNLRLTTQALARPT